jgi:hypothetical protein
MSTSPEQDVKVFRAAVLPVFTPMAAVGLPLYFCIILFTDGLHRVDVPALFIGALAEALFCLVYAWVMTLCFTLKLTSEGVLGHSVWGLRRFIRWQDVATIRPFRFFSLRYLRLYPESGNRPIWIASFQARRADFEQELRRLSPPDCPIRKYLL